jgi:TonB family protein
MMKNIIRSPYRKMKILLILPVFAIVLWAFAKPDYKYKNTEQYPVSSMASVSVQQHEVKGKVVEKDGSALPGASVVVLNTNQGISTDDKGFFKLDIPENGTIVVSFVGYKSKVLKPVFTSEMVITMVRDTLKYLKANISTPPPPPPPPVNEIKENSGAAPQPSPLPLINEVEEISSITPPPPPPPPAESGVSIAGDKQPKSAIDKEVMVIVEALPEFIGGTDAMTAWINSNLKYPADAVKSKITGKVLVNFTVTAKGKIENVVVIKSISPVLDAEAKRVISSMPDWKPGMQAGKNVPVQLQVPVEFKLN